ncbi:kinase-like domain-containing protein [Zopfochytrium polystomum]|nr:kinase-like domain-containing protein [Zopfochytrium polystomum]
MESRFFHLPDVDPQPKKIFPFISSDFSSVVRCHHKPTGTMVLIRTYGRGSDVLIDRKQELMNMLALSKLGLCPPLYARFKNGLVYGYIEGSPFTVPDMQDPHKSNLVASNLGVWHKVQLPIPRQSKLFSTMRRWLDAVPDHFTNPETEQRTTAFISKAMLRAELDTLESALEALNAPIVFSHCDLLCNNIIYTPRTDTVQFIDYEYGCYAPRGFDIGNHFCEHAGFDCEWERYPGEAFQKQWLKAYLAASGEPNPSREDIQRLYAEVNKYALAAHLYWGLWALVQAEISDLDFDYAGYAMLRLTEYLRRKAEFLAL